MYRARRGGHVADLAQRLLSNMMCLKTHGMLVASASWLSFLIPHKCFDFEGCVLGPQVRTPWTCMHDRWELFNIAITPVCLLESMHFAYNAWTSGNNKHMRACLFVVR